MEEEVINIFKEFDVCLNIAVPYGSLGENFSRLLRRYEEEDVEVCLWLLLPFELGYWPSEVNVQEFSSYIDEVFNWADEEDLFVPWIGVDLETPIYQLYDLWKKPFFEKFPAALRLGFSNLNEDRFDDAVVGFNSVLDKIHAYGAKTLTAVDPVVINDGVMENNFIQDLMEVPIFDVEWDRVSFMIYTSMLSGYSRGLISRKDSTYLLYNYLTDAKEILSDRAAVSVGLTGIGVIGNEPHYSEPESLKPDIEAALAAGIKDLSIFSIEGILNKENPKTWFEMIKNSKPKKPNPTLKTDLIRGALKLGSSLGTKFLR